MTERKDCEAIFTQEQHKNPDFVMTVITCQLCEIGRVGLADVGRGEEAIEENNRAIIRFKSSVCPKATGEFTHENPYRGPI